MTSLPRRYIMPKATKTKYYAVKVGREGPKIYTTWDECKKNVTRWPSAVHKSFVLRTAAEEWLRTQPTASAAPGILNQPISSSSNSNITSYRRTMPTYESMECESPPPYKSRSPSPTLVTDGVVVPKVKLSPEQSAVLQRVKDGENVFFTGSAGTGKSVLLREIIASLGKSSASAVAITASTGIASVNIGGTTLHSWAGIGLGQEPAKNFAGKFMGQPKFIKVLERWRQVRTLIIDEISMIDGLLFDKLEEIARRLRKDDRPFGGIQLVLSGDFCQLPPVPDRRDGVQIPSTFAFEARSWDACVGRPVSLTRVYRQKDQSFVDMLNSLRFGELNPKIISEFQKLSRNVVYNDGIEPTDLFATRREVDFANRTRLQQLPEPAHTYNATDIPGRDQRGQVVGIEQMERLLERLVVPKTITLKIGAQVMLVKNLVQGELVNGSVGQVVAFSTPFDHQRNSADAGQAEGSKGPPQAESNTRGIEPSWPLVRFTSGKETLCTPAEFTVNNAQGETEAQRSQVPLILAWALSVHKSQGQTLERVRVDLGGTFEKGQAYVALSRATSMKTLQVVRFHPSKVMAHPRVLAWYKGIQGRSSSYSDDEDEMDNMEAISAYYDM